MQDRFEIDLGDVSSLDYYTGLSLKVFVHGAGTSVGRGGRYDGLTGNFGRAEPAVGFVLNLDALTEVLGREGREVDDHDRDCKRQNAGRRAGVVGARRHST